jgi:biofilm PGA synthesis protein PgaD
MPSGEAPIAESSTLEALLARLQSHHRPPRRPLPTGILSLLTLLFWGIWLYLVLPLVSLLLWFFGVRLFIQEIAKGAYEGLRASLTAYSLILLVLVALLALWIAWNVSRYGGRHDRRTVRREDVTDGEVQKWFRLDGSLLSVLRGERFVHVDLDGEGCVMVMATSPSRLPPAPERGPDGGPQRGLSTRSG